ncbi:Hypothetical protein A7982_10750 [Minicystis rosea]|nr:Hypothetical protein A7982_10750 [Minicystis rosea]
MITNPGRGDRPGAIRSTSRGRVGHHERDRTGPRRIMRRGPRCKDSTRIKQRDLLCVRRDFGRPGR